MAFTLDKYLTLKRKIVLFAVGALLAVWVVSLLVFLPQRTRLAELDAMYQAERRQVEIIEAHILAHPDAARHMAELDARRAVVDRLLPESPGVGDFLVAVERAARAGGVQLLHVRPGPAAAKSGYQETPLEVLVRGDFFKTVAFLRQMEDGPRFSAVNGLTMSVKNGVLESKLNVVIFSVKK